MTDQNAQTALADHHRGIAAGVTGQRAWRDVLAGLAIAGLLLPEAVAYAGIAGLAPMAGLTAAIVGGLAYAIVGRSRCAIISPTSSAAALLAASLAALPDRSDLAAAASQLTAMTGLIFLGLAAARLGSLSGFVSRPVLRGFIFGLAITIILAQLPHLLGIPNGRSDALTMLTGLGSRWAMVHWPSAATGLIALGLLLALRRFPAIPAALLVLVAATAGYRLLDLEQMGVSGSPGLNAGWPDAGVLTTGGNAAVELFWLAVPIALILFAESWGTIRSIALRHGDSVSAGREIAALGAANLASGLAQGMPVGAGFSAGAANEAAGARSRLSNAIACAVLAIVIVAAPALVSDIPQPVLAAMVIAALSHTLAFAPIRTLLRLRRDYWISIAAALGVLLLGILNGMLFAIGLSLLAVLRRLSRPRISELGRAFQREHDFVDLVQHPDAAKLSDVSIFRPNAPLFFANAETTMAGIAQKMRERHDRHLIISLEESDDLDSTAIEVLVEFERSLADRGIRLSLARLHDHARQGLMLVDPGLAKDATFSVADAVDCVLRARQTDGH